MSGKRRFLTEIDLRRLDKSMEYASFQTGDKDVAESQEIKGTRTTNPNMPEDVVCMWRGFYPQNYGKYHVIFRFDDLFLTPTNPPEYWHRGVIRAVAVGYTTTEELKRAGRI
jgi:hypothetical protein